MVQRPSGCAEQFRAIGWCRGCLCSAIFEVRYDSEVSTIISSLRGDQPNRNCKAMPKTSKKAPTADEIADRASRGEDISAFFTNKFTVVRPVRRVNIDLTQGMLRDLDERAA